MIDRVMNSASASVPLPGRAAAAPGSKAITIARQSAETDAVELSDAARQQIEDTGPAGIRASLVERVRAEIAAGTYLSDEKLNTAVERLHEMLFAAV